MKILFTFSGLGLSAAEEKILKEGFKPGTVAEAARKGRTPGTVVGVSPHSPTAVHRGVAIGLTICSRWPETPPLRLVALPGGAESRRAECRAGPGPRTETEVHVDGLIPVA